MLNMRVRQGNKSLRLALPLSRLGPRQAICTVPPQLQLSAKAQNLVALTLQASGHIPLAQMTMRCRDTHSDSDVERVRNGKCIDYLA